MSHFGPAGAVLTALSIAIAITTAAAADVAGKPYIVDGDTIEIAGQRVRLHGIDAPESGQSCEAGGKAWQCGQEAGFALAEMIGTTWVECAERDRDRYGRIVAVCRIGGAKGKDLNGAMVAHGWALAYRQYSADYIDAERAAQAAGAGLWRGAFSYRPGTGGAAHDSLRKRQTTIGNARSRATSQRAGAYTTCPADTFTSEPGSTNLPGNDGSVPKQKHRPPGGDGRSDRKWHQ